MLPLHFMLILLLAQLQCGAKHLALARAEDTKRFPAAGRDRVQVTNSGDLGAHCKKWHRDTPGCGVRTPEYQIWQPCSLSAKVNDTLILPCLFNATWEASQAPEVYWRIGGFHGEFFFNYTQKPSYTNSQFFGRVSLVGDPWKCKDASIRISQLRESDTNVYFCRICMKTKDSDTKKWQAVKETNLTVTASTLEPPVRLQGLLVGGAIFAVALALGLGMFIAWRKGYFTKRPGPSTRRSPGAPSRQEQRGDSRADAPLPGRPAEAAQPGPLYAALALPGDPGKMPPARYPRAAHGEASVVYAELRR